MLAFSAALEPLRMANRLADRQLYSWEILAETMEPVLASSGLSITPDPNGRRRPRSRYGAGLRWSGYSSQHTQTTSELPTTRDAESYRWARYAPGATRWRKPVYSTDIGAPFTGKISPVCEKPFPEIVVTTEVFEIDRDRYTSSGGSAPLDMMLHIIAADHGQELANTISEEFICEANSRQT